MNELKEYKSKKSRLGSIDAVSGLLIMFMITMHALQFTDNTNTNFYYWINIIFSFFMPYFFFKSGMFFKGDSSKICFKKNAIKYFTPFLFYIVVGEIIRDVRLYIDENLTISDIVINSLKILVQGSTPGNAPLWFLLTLFFVRNISNYVLIRSLSLKFILPILLISSSIIINFVSDCIYFPFWIGNTLLGCFFYLIGYLFNSIQYNKIIFVCSLFGYFSIMLLQPSLVNFWKSILIYGNFYIWVIFSLCGILVFNNVFERIKLLNFHVLINIGEDSMSYYCFHWIWFNIVGIFFLLFPIIENINKFYFLILSCVIVLPVYSYVCKIIKRKYNIFYL